MLLAHALRAGAALALPERAAYLPSIMRAGAALALPERAAYPPNIMRAGAALALPERAAYPPNIMRAGAAPRAPRWGRSAPPNPLQIRLGARSAYWHMPPLCHELDHLL